MSDVAIAPAPSTPAAPAGGASEVPINPNPVSAPAPVGQQAPNKPVGPDHQGSPHRPESRRESIQRAFERAKNAKPAEAKMGHNNPPEPMVKERAKPKAEEAIDLKKRPDDQPARPRGDHGHFAPRATEGSENQAPRPAPQAGQPQAQAQAQPRVQPLPEHARFREPLERMSPLARTEWHTTPESVRADVHRMHQEFAQAYQRYRGDHETMNTIRHFHQMAQQHGTTLDRALSNYVNMENKLRNDPIGGLDVIVSNLNLRAPDGSKIGLKDIAYYVLNQTPEQHRLMQSTNHQMAQSHQLVAATQRIAALEQNAAQMQYAQRFVVTRRAVDQYATTHPRLDELSDLVEQEINFGFDLDTAYRRAELLRPAGTAAQTRTNGNGTAAQTRSDRSIRGAPNGSNGAQQARRKEPVGRRDAIANAIRRIGGGAY